MTSSTGSMSRPATGGKRDVPSPAMDPDDELHAFARHELVLIGVVLVALGRLVPTDEALLVAAMLPVVIVLAGMGVIEGTRPGSRPLETLLIPAVLTGGTSAALHLVPVGLGLIPALLAFAVLLDRTLVLELRLASQVAGASRSDRSRVLLVAVVTAFVTFTGIAALVPGGMAGPVGATGGGGANTPSLSWLLVLVIGDALVALALGYRVAVFRYGTTLMAARSAVTYAIVVAIAAGAIRAIGLPRLVGPAALTLVFYLWDALHGTAPARRRDPRFVWETILLVALGIIVVLWNQRVPG
jgi:hypothetical protein